MFELDLFWFCFKNWINNEY